MQLRVPPSHPQGQRGFDSVIDISNKKEKIAKLPHHLQARLKTF